MNLTHREPFHLREHSLLPSRKPAPEGWNVLAEIGHFKILRAPQRHKNVAAAAPPTAEDAYDAVVPVAAGDVATPELARKARSSMTKLVTRARKGDGQALWFFAQLVCECAEGLSQMATAKPESLRPIARTMARWPLMMSPHPKNCDNSEVLSRMELGVAVPVQIDKYSKWKPGHAANIAVDLVQHLEFLRSENPRIRLDGSRKAVSFSEWLPPFRQESRDQWWECARKFLLDSYPNPEQIDEFARIVPEKSGKRRSPGRLKQKILDDIRSRFFALAK